MKTWLAGGLIVCAGLWSIARLTGDADARLSFDSVRYYAGALSILEEGRYSDLDGGPQQVWPPGLSLLYAGLARVTGADPLALVAAVNAFCYVLTMLALVVLGRAAGMRWFVLAAMLAAFAWNSHYISMHNKLWSEPPAMALLAAVLLALVLALREPRRAARYLALASVITAAAITLRYAATALVPVLMVVAVMTRRRWLVLASLATTLPLLLALTLLGASRGSREVGVQFVPWSDNAHAALPLAAQIVPPRMPGGAAIGVAVLLMWVGAGVMLAYRDRRRHALTVALLWCMAYGAFLPFAQIFTVPSFRIDLRVLMPLYAGLVIVAAAAAEAAMRSGRRWLAVLLVVPLIVAGLRGGRFMLTASRPAADCVSRQWYVDAIRGAAPAGTVATNAQGTVWLALRRPVLTEGPAEQFIWIDPAIACESVVENPLAPRPAAPPGERGLVISPSTADGRFAPPAQSR